MKSKAILLSMLIITCMMASGQHPVLELTFTAVDNAAWIKLDRIRIENRTQGGDIVLHWPDTMLMVYPLGTQENVHEPNVFQVFQNYPNPMTDQTTISLFIPAKETVSLVVSDMLGRIILRSDRVLDAGTHSFRFTTGSGNLYFFTAHWQGSSQSIRMLHTGKDMGIGCSLEFLGGEPSPAELKVKAEINEFAFAQGDELLFIGYANGMESGILFTPAGKQTVTFQFASGIPCPGMPVVEYGGQTYNTVQIFSQCWLKENLNIGTMIPGVNGQSNNGIIEKYCYGNDERNCKLYGGLYQWNEMMQYSSQQGTRGICPPGWHMPTDEDWKIMEGAVDNQYGIGDPEWDRYWDYRGTDAGINLKSSYFWVEDGNGSNIFGFSGQPGGSRNFDGQFGGVGYVGIWWTSTAINSCHVWYHYFNYSYQQVYRNGDNRNYGFSVRCLKDY